MREGAKGGREEERKRIKRREGDNGNGGGRGERDGLRGEMKAYT